ncbi:glycosyl hydrolase family 28-related protein [Roseicyclus persicicus]|uniref:Right-handed parallel beta-helix repeat-containing protein n=1 Tax=Roseicyclus persicicus TaxID=2650661 RepID=A0A7X6JVB7_9RHOB|nr:glycosyl hydrolase family 28-related protein [Roseibacterium persicicum]NKX43167.1 right-handed parallel beta-helix repeat-containing protein [Roseibacterium persicicum]
MNQVITDGLALMPPPFSDGLTVWSRQDGRPGSDTWATAPNAALVAADADFGACLEILKTEATTRLRYMGQTPIIPGLYLRVSARVKVLSGNLPTVRIAAWAGTAAGQNLTGVPQAGPETGLTAYGEVVTVSAIIGTGARGGVDMPWGPAAGFGHVGLDLTGPNGGQVRIESITVEDVTSVFLRKLMDWVDVTDFGARGDGITDDRDAFVAADAAAAGREVLVPAGTYLIGSSLTLTNPVRFEGKLTMPDGARLALNQNFDLKGYAEAFGDDVLGLKKGLQQLFNQSDYEGFDLCGRRVVLDAPIDVQAVVGNRNTYANRRMLRNGQLSAAPSPAWDDEVHSRSGTWSSSDPRRISGLSNVADIPLGALVTAPQGVGREIYVIAKDVAGGRVTLSGSLSRAPVTQTYTFRRFRYMLDFLGWLNLQRFVISDIEFLCAGQCSGLNLPIDGLVFQIHDCFFTGPKDRAITSAGEGCQGMQIDRCQFLSNEQTTDAPLRTTIAFNSNCSDIKVRDNRAVKFRHFGVIAGTGNILSGNHFFQGDGVTDGPRTAGLVLCDNNAKTTIEGNYIDNCYIEWGNERDPEPDFTTGLSFHGLTLNGNIFFATGSAPWMNFILIKPYGTGHFINGLSVCDNLFKKTGGAVLEAVEGVDTTFAPLDLARTSDLLFTGNTYHGITKRTENPVTVRHVQGTASATWNVDLTDVAPFGSAVRGGVSFLAEGPLRSASNVIVYLSPYAEPGQGAGGRTLQMKWSQDVRGTAQITARFDI